MYIFSCGPCLMFVFLPSTFPSLIFLCSFFFPILCFPVLKEFLASDSFFRCIYSATQPIYWVKKKKLKSLISIKMWFFIACSFYLMVMLSSYFSKYVKHSVNKKSCHNCFPNSISLELAVLFAKFPSLRLLMFGEPSLCAYF